jgi:putative SOS response-associated peptidase YedK
MCKRYTEADIDEINQMVFDDFGLSWDQIFARYNISPSQLVPSIERRDDLLPEATMMHWGFPAAWDEEFVQHNARAETVATSKMFRYFGALG